MTIELTFGVLPFVFSARKRAFSAPRIWTVEAGYLAKLVNEPLLYQPTSLRCVHLLTHG